MRSPVDFCPRPLVAAVIALTMSACSKDLPTGPAGHAGGTPSLATTLSAPANDDFNSAITVTRVGFTSRINTTQATTAADDPIPSCANGGRGPTVWYAFTSSRNKRIEANTFGSDYDSDLAIYTGTRGNLTEIGCNDDAGDGVQSQVVFDAVPGQTYYIMVGAFASGPGGNLVFNLVNPSAEVFRTRFFHDGNLVHIIPEHNVTFTVGEVVPLADQLFCGGTETYVSDVRATSQIVATPTGPLKLLDRVEGTFVLYGVSLFDLEDYCDLAQYEIGRGSGSFTRTDNSITGVGPGLNAFGFMAQADLVLTGGGTAKFQAIMRQLYDGVNVTTVVDNVQLK
jgi:hypothetical protein